MKKHILKLILLFFFSLTLNVVLAKESNIAYTEETYINPEYADIYNEQDFQGSLFYYNNQANTDIETFTNIEEAAQVLKEAFIERLGTVTIKIQTDYIPKKTMARDISNLAFSHTGVPTEGDYIAKQFGGWKASVIKEIPDNNEPIIYTIIYLNIKYHTSKEQEQEMDIKIKEVLDSLNLKGKSDYEKIKSIYEYIITNVTYDREHEHDNTYTLKHTAYAALINHTAVCQGYAVLFYRMALEEGIDARYISGLSHGISHGWNIVKIGKYYYNLDSTWDAGKNISFVQWFLKSMSTFKDHERDNGILNDIDYTSTEFNSLYPMSPTDYSPESEPLLGDLNKNNIIDLTDVLMLLKLYFNEPEEFSYQADINCDNKITLTDVLMLLKLYFNYN